MTKKLTLTTGSKENPSDHLVIPDHHAYPSDDFSRFEQLGNYIVENQPKVIIDIGDGWDMPSLCSFDKGKKSFMFQSVKEDIEAGHKAEELIFGPMLQYNNTRSQWKKKQYNPAIIKILGNHEARVAKLLEYEPRWDGVLSMDSFRTRLPIKEQVVDFLDYCIIDDIAYSHYFVSGVMSRPCSSARILLQKKLMSCTMGHTHTLESADGVRADGKRMRALICGSFHAKDHKGFAGTQVDSIYWNGLIHKLNVNEGDYDRVEIGMDRLEREYV